MAQRAKQWLAKQSSPFAASQKDGGIIGSLIGLGYAKKQVVQFADGPRWTGFYVITGKGKDWTKHQR